MAAPPRFALAEGPRRSGDSPARCGGNEAVLVALRPRRRKNRHGLCFAVFWLLEANSVQNRSPTPPGGHPTQFFTRGRFLMAPGPENGPPKPKTTKSRNRHFCFVAPGGRLPARGREQTKREERRAPGEVVEFSGGPRHGQNMTSGETGRGAFSGRGAPPLEPSASRWPPRSPAGFLEAPKRPLGAPRDPQKAPERPPRCLKEASERPTR